MSGHFDIPLDLPHAGTIARRIQRILEARSAEEPETYASLLDTVEQLVELLWKASSTGENPPEAEANAFRETAADLGRTLVSQIESLEVGSDRLGQFVRNLFECLALGKEGAALSLRAGEDPGSLMRPQ